MVLGVACAGPAGAAVVKSSFGVGAVVVAGCRIVPGQAQACAPQAAPAAAPTPRPVVRYSKDLKSGGVTETIEF
jgi:hypothetical protein